jgi:creatinine amidohydrolase
MAEHVLYEELTPMEFRKRIAEAPVAYLPLGTLEWHGEHLPLGSDGMQSRGFFIQLAEEVGGIVLPMLFLGPDRHEVVRDGDFYGMDNYGFPEGQPHQLDGSAYWVDDELFRRMLEAILAQLARAGFKIVVGHGHGPSTRFFQEHSAEWSDRFGLQLYVCWRERAEEADGLGIQTDHAAANETSLMMALHPQLIRMDNLPSDLDKWPVAVSGSDPRTEASAERGWRAIRLQAERMADILRDAISKLG